MQVTIDIPDTLAAQFAAAGKNPARAALEALAVEGYRSGKLSESDAREWLGYETRMEVHALLTANGVDLHYSPEHLQLDIAASEKLLFQRTHGTARAA